jgi:hypothetical protein
MNLYDNGLGQRKLIQTLNHPLVVDYAYKSITMKMFRLPVEMWTF